MRVVLPAPLGPISAWISPAATDRSTRFVASTPPKCLCSRSTRSNGSATLETLLAHEGGQHSSDALAREQDDDKQHTPEAQLPVDRVAGQHLLQKKEHERPERSTPQVADAAQDHHHHQSARLGPLEEIGAYEAALIGEQRTREAGRSASDGEADQLVAVSGKADGFHAGLILADSLNHLSEAGLQQASHQIQAQRDDRQDGVVKGEIASQIQPEPERRALREVEPVLAAVATHR